MWKKLFEHRCKYRSRLEELEVRFASLEKEVQNIRLEKDAEIASLKEKLSQFENPRNSSNSSIPPSQDPYRKKYPKKEKSDRSGGGQKGHKGHYHAWENNPNETISLNPEHCPYCGSAELTLYPDDIESRQEVSLPEIKPVVTEYQAIACRCRNCGKRSRANFPETIKAKVQMSQSVENLAAYLKTLHHASHDKIAECLNDVFSLSVSHGWVQLALERVQERLTPVYQQLKEELGKQSVLHSDETGCPVKGKRQWFWVFGNENLCIYVASEKRNFAVIEDTVGKSFLGSWVSDRYGAQIKIECFHQFCLSHLTREAKGCDDSYDTIWSGFFLAFLQEVIHLRNQWGENWSLQNPEVTQKITQANAKLDALFAKPPPKPEIWEKKTRERTLFEQLSKHRDKILHFLENPLVPPTNNLAERLLRCFVVHRKVSGGFKTTKGAQGHAIFLSVMQTARLQGKNVFQVLSQNQPLLQAPS